MSAVKVLIVDKEELVRAGIRFILGKPGITIVGEAENADDAAEKAATLRPDVIVIEIRPPGGSFDIIEKIQTRLPKARILVFTDSDEDSDYIMAVRMGAQGYQTKRSSPRELLVALKKVASGRTALPIPTIT